MEIQPDKQNIDQTFATTIYFIDFYQRDYKWTNEPVKRLLDDIFYQFEDTYAAHEELEPNRENVNDKYPWYYLNTYVTNMVGGRVFVVDGQQRLTTLTLILFSLLKMAKELDSETAGWLKTKISGYSGTKHQFWMNHEKHIQVFEGLLSGKELNKISAESGISAVNMLGNYNLIETELTDRLTDQHKFDTFVHYFLFRLVLINLSVDTKHVPMVFEVINDRGVRLKPYEILKGKLLGQIDKLELEQGKFNETWETQVSAVNAFNEDEIDNFFRHWLKAKFSETRNAGKRFDADYHREIFKSDMNDQLELDHNPAEVKAFLNGSFKYYTSLYCKIWVRTKELSSSSPAVFYNDLNDLDSQFMLIMSACSVNDTEEELKIGAVSSGLDRMFAFLQLQGAYNSNDFAVRLSQLSTDLRDAKAELIRGLFDKHLIEELNLQRSQDLATPVNFSLFSSMSVDRLPKRFTRYLLGRVDEFIAEGSKLEMKQPLKQLVTAP